MRSVMLQINEYDDDDDNDDNVFIVKDEKLYFWNTVQ